MFNKKVARKQATQVKSMTTQRLKAILADPYTRGVDGADYFHSRRHELEAELWRRESRISVQLFDDLDKQQVQKERWQEGEKARLRAQVTALALCPPEDPQAFLALLERLKIDIEIVTEQDTCPFLWACVVNELSPSTANRSNTGALDNTNEPLPLSTTQN